MLKTRIIKAPGKYTISIIRSRLKKSDIDFDDNIGAIGLVQGSLCEMLCAADVAEKVASVKVMDLLGNCPQTVLTIGIFGDITDVEAAITVIKEKDKRGDESW